MSSEPKNTTTSPSDEIDLRALFVAVGNFFRRLSLNILYLIIFLRNAVFRHKVILIIGGVAGLIGGYAYHNVARPFYTSSMVVNSYYFKGNLIQNAFDNLNELCSEGNHITLGEKLHIDSLSASYLKSFSLEPIISEESILETEALISQLDVGEDARLIESLRSRIAIENQTTYKVIAEVFNNQVFPELDSAVVKFLLENKFIQKRIDVSRIDVRAKADKLRAEQLRLDSLKGLVYLTYAKLAAEDNQGNNNVYVDSEARMLDPLSIFREDLRLYDEEQGLRRKLELRDEIEIIDGFTLFTRPQTPSRKKAMIYGFALGFGLALLLGFLLDFNRYLNQVEAQRNQPQPA
ncbi:MAG TPA: hypothetical protein DCE41_09395 [Cytophagales bacterium]|nr:hypothetical protein [Cytophagales bacterium]HAA17444.1 hypothetical protein [Cytophagales bacterium]HAP62415.1 hypothetical protein [Cytophagales bacterium]